MTEKEKAEAYVRSKCPELMELSFGCKILKFDREMIFIALTSYDNGSHSLTFRAPNGTVHNGTYYTNEIEELIIIGHPIQLQHWIEAIWKSKADLKQLTRKLEFDPRYKTVYHEVDNIAMTARSIKIQFDGNGQPATEADYQAFNQIVGI